MEDMKKLLLSTATFLTLTLASSAAVITETLDFGTITGDKQLYFNQFNTALGTLNSVTLTWTINSSISTAEITNQNTGAVTVTRIAFTNTVEGYVPSIGMSGDLVAEVSKSRSVTPNGSSVTLATGQSYTVNNITFSGFTEENYYTAADSNFSAFQGTGQVPIYLANTFGATPTASGAGSNMAWLTSITGSSTGNLQVTYDYTAAIAPVPEPSAFILGGGGLLFLGFFAFKNKKRGAGATSTPALAA